LGTVFFGESMFHTKTDASKVALYYLTRFLTENKFELIDAQQDTAHLRSLGAYTIDRNEFLDLLSDHVQKASLTGNWGNGEMKEQIVEI
jgi:leucyl/phenylalanyl-tRNA--protein transferase